MPKGIHGKRSFRVPGASAPNRSRKKDRALVQRVLADVLEPVAQLQKPVLVKLLPILSQAQQELETSLLCWLKTQQGHYRFTAQRYRNALVQIRSALRQVAEIEPELVAALQSAGKTAGVLATRHLERELARFSSVFEGSIQVLPLEEAVILARGNRLLIPRFKASAKRYSGQVGDEALRVLAISRAKNETMDELASRLETRLSRIFAGQRFAAERLARTETMHAYNVFHHESLKEAHREDGDLRMRWDASFDRRRCPQCASLDGKIVAIDSVFVANWTTRRANGSAMRHRLASVHPPAHPNCRCVLVPWKQSWPDVDHWRPSKPSGSQLVS